MICKRRGMWRPPADAFQLLVNSRRQALDQALVAQPQDIRPAMERARASGKPSCVNVILDPDIYSSGTMNQTIYT